MCIALPNPLIIHFEHALLKCERPFKCFEMLASSAIAFFYEGRGHGAYLRHNVMTACNERSIHNALFAHTAN